MKEIINFLVTNSPTIGLVFFVSVFCVILFITLRPKNKKKYQDYSKIPFKDE